MIELDRRRLAEIRVRKGFSQRGLALLSGLSSTYVSQLEREMRHPGPDTAKKLCDALGIEFDEVFQIRG